MKRALLSSAQRWLWPPPRSRSRRGPRPQACEAVRHPAAASAPARVSGMSAGGAIAAPRSGGNFAVSPGGAPRTAVSPGAAPRSGGQSFAAGRTQLAGWRQLATSPPPSLPRTGHSLRVRRAVLLRLRHAVCVRGRRRLLADPAATGRIRPRLGLRLASTGIDKQTRRASARRVFCTPIDGSSASLDREERPSPEPSRTCGRPQPVDSSD